MTSTPDTRDATARFRAAAKRRAAAVATLTDADAALAEAMESVHESGEMLWSEIAEVAAVAIPPVEIESSDDEERERALRKFAAATAMWRTRNLPGAAEKTVQPDTEVEGWLTLSEAAAALGLTAAQLRSRLKNPANPLHERVTEHKGWRRNREVSFYEVAD